MKNTTKTIAKNIAKRMLKEVFIEDLKTKTKTSLIEKIKEEELKENKDFFNIKTVLKTNKRLWSIKLYSNKEAFNEYWLLEEYNWIKTNNKVYSIKKIKQLEELYNSLFNELYNWQTRQDLFNIYKTYFKTSINDNWIRKTLKDKIEFEASINYFILNILEDKITNKTNIKKDFIISKYLQFLKYNSIEDIEDLSINWQAIQDWIEEVVNNKYIIEKLNKDWLLTKYKALIEEEDFIKNEYINSREEIKKGLINKDKKSLYTKEYKKALSNIIHKKHNIEKLLKIDLYK